MKKKGLRKVQDVAFLGANTLQATQLLKGVSPVSTIPGFVGIGIAGSVANVSSKMISDTYYKKSKSKKKRRW